MWKALILDIFCLKTGTIKGVGHIYLQAVVDTYGSFAFGKLYTSKLPETAVDVL